MKNLMALMLLAVSGNLLAADSAQTCTSVLTDQNGNEVSAFAFNDSCTDANYSCLNTLSEKLASGEILAGNCAEDSFRRRPGPGSRPGVGPTPSRPSRPPGGGIGPGPGPRPPHYPGPGPGPGPAPRPPHYPVPGPGPGPRPPGYPVPPPPPPIYYNCTVDMVNAYNNMLIRRYWETAPSRYSACNQALSRCEFDRRYQYEPTRCFIAY